MRFGRLKSASRRSGRLVPRATMSTAVAPSDLLGHTVDVRTRLARGSMFAVELPLGRAEDVPPRAQRRYETTISDNRGGVVLIVEDDPGVRDILALVFRNSGFATLTAEDGPEASKLFARGAPIPELFVSRSGEVPAVILTGDIATETSVAISRQGHTRLVEPVKLDELMGLTQELLQSRQPANAARGAGRSGGASAGPAVSSR